MSLARFGKHLVAKTKKKNKYRAKKVEHAGRSFDSQLEKAVYDILLLRKAAGEFDEIIQQDQVYLTLANILYKPDYKCLKNGEPILWVEAKGLRTAVWAIKRRLWKRYGPGPLEVWEGTWSRPKLTEIISPKGNP